MSGMDWRGWIARKVLSWVNKIDPDAKFVCDAKEKWMFRRHWQQPRYDNVTAEKPRATLSGRAPETPASPGAPAPVDPVTGMNRDYWVLPEEERAKGFVRPVRDSYVHDACGVRTIMATALAETYARDPKYYGSTFCAGSGCRRHFPVGEFKWDGTDERVGS